MDEKKKYKALEPVLKEINKKFVSLSEEDTKRNNNVLKSILDLMLAKMKEKDTLFKEMFSRVFFGGSFYDGLRVGQPDEFDLDLLLTLPKLVEPTITTSNIPGFVRLQLKQYMKFFKQLDLAVRYKGLEKFIDDDNYMDTGKVLQWMESVVSLALNEFEKSGKERLLKTPGGTLYARICKGGPAFTLKVHGVYNGKSISMDIDLVPCFVFGKEQWPKDGFRANPIQKKPEYFIVPKPLKNVEKSGRYWRLSFQEQERQIIDSKGSLKPAVRLLKKMRDNYDHKCIASYYIKTCVLWVAFEGKDETFWTNSLSYIFMHFLKEYHNCLNGTNIKYFWNKNNNLIGNIKTITISNISSKIKAVIEDVEKHPEDPFIIAKHLCTKTELAQFQNELSSNNELNLLMSKAKI